LPDLKLRTGIYENRGSKFERADRGVKYVNVLGFPQVYLKNETSAKIYIDFKIDHSPPVANETTSNAVKSGLLKTSTSKSVTPMMFLIGSGEVQNLTWSPR
jgi:hypothetical protein